MNLNWEMLLTLQNSKRLWRTEYSVMALNSRKKNVGFCTFGRVETRVQTGRLEAGEQLSREGSGVAIDNRINISQHCILAAKSSLNTST